MRLRRPKRYPIATDRIFYGYKCQDTLDLNLENFAAESKTNGSSYQ